MSEQEPTPPKVITAALEALFELDERWKPKPSPDVTIVTRGWPDGTTDTLILLSPDTAHAVRETPDGRRPWSMSGPLEHILYQARRLVPLDHPDAPQAPGSDLPKAKWR